MRHLHRLGQGHFKGGYTLIEVITTITIMVMILLAVMGGYRSRIDKAKLEKTISEMMYLAEASLDFYHTQGVWPISPLDLRPGYMYAALISSPFGGVYQINSLNDEGVSISTTIPSGIAKNYNQGTLLEISSGFPNDIITISQRSYNSFSGRLEYEKKYTYQQSSF